MTLRNVSELSNKPFLIGVVGDSLSLPRQFDGIEFHQTYPFLLADWLRKQGVSAHVWMMSKGGVPINELLGRYDEFERYVGPRCGGIGVVQIGIVDCAPRPLPYRLRQVLGRVPVHIRGPIVRFLNWKRKPLLKAGLSFRFTSPREFARQYRMLLGKIVKEFDHGYAINICPPGGQIAERSPGIKESIKMYNTIIGESVALFGEISLVDVWTEFSSSLEPVDLFVSPEDGHHLTVVGHHRIFELIRNREDKCCQGTVN